MAALPEVPTLREAGVPDYYLTFWYGAWVPARLAAIVARVDELLGKAIKPPAAQAALKNGGADNFDLMGAFAKFQVDEIARFGRIVKAANMEQHDMFEPN
jgi:tripartite-type tricarboxylate transporter receptor subunit TctC